MSGAEPRGRTRITAKALERVTAAVTGEAFGSPGERVRVGLTDHGGALDVAVTTGIRTVSLTRALEEPRSVGRVGGSIVQRTEDAEGVIRTRVQQLTGYAVQRVEVRITAVHVQQERRVR